MGKEFFPVPLEEAVGIVQEMQRNCLEAYLTVALSLRAGMTEEKVARQIKGELTSRGIEDYWYNIPVMVLIGAERFKEMTADDYAIKEPSDQKVLQEGMPFFIDMHPRDSASGQWGNFAATGVYRERDRRVGDFLLEMQNIQGEIVGNLRGDFTGAQVADRFTLAFKKNSITPVDVRGNFGHSMGYGEKAGPYQRQFLDSENFQKIGGQIFGIEPGGYKVVVGETGLVLVARFEDCVCVPEQGPARILGRDWPVSVRFINR